MAVCICNDIMAIICMSISIQVDFWVYTVAPHLSVPQRSETLGLPKALVSMHNYKTRLRS